MKTIVLLVGFPIAVAAVLLEASVYYTCLVINRTLKWVLNK